MRAILIDDEKHALENLQILFEEYCPDVKVVGSFLKPLEAIEQINKQNPDVVFLDISMPVMDGFELLEAIGNINFHVVFVTAHENHAIQAIKKKAFDYLLKPIQIKELINCVHNLRIQSKKSINRLCICTADSIEFVKISSIIYCMSESSYCHIYLDDGNHYFFTKQLKKLASELPEKMFFRCHNSYIINKLFVKRYNKLENVLELEEEVFIPVARSRKDEVLHWLTDGI